MRWLVGVVALLAVASCSSGDDARVDSMGFVAVGQSDATDGCGVDDVGRLVVGFLDVFNSADIGSRVDEFFAPASRFGWFSVQGIGERLNREASDRATLGDYLQTRADAGERLRLVGMDTEYERDRNITHIGYNIERRAPATMENPTVVIGKGAIDCESGKITVWSMGTSDAGTQALCPSTPRNVDPTLPIVCVRQGHES